MDPHAAEGRRTAIERRLSAVESLYRDQVLLSRLRGVHGRRPGPGATGSAGCHGEGARKGPACRGVDTGSRARSRGPPRRLAAAYGSRRPLSWRGKTLIRSMTALLWTGRSARSPSILLTEGNLIRRGFDAELDRLHGLEGQRPRHPGKVPRGRAGKTGIGFAEAAVQQDHRVLLRGHEVKPRSRACALHPAPVPRGRGAVSRRTGWPTSSRRSTRRRRGSSRSRRISSWRCASKVKEAVPWLLELS